MNIKMQIKRNSYLTAVLIMSQAFCYRSTVSLKQNVRPVTDIFKHFLFIDSEMLTAALLLKAGQYYPFKAELGR